MEEICISIVEKGLAGYIYFATESDKDYPEFLEKPKQSSCENLF